MHQAKNAKAMCALFFQALCVSKVIGKTEKKNHSLYLDKLNLIRISFFNAYKNEFHQYLHWGIYRLRK